MSCSFLKHYECYGHVKLVVCMLHCDVSTAWHTLLIKWQSERRGLRGGMSDDSAIQNPLPELTISLSTTLLRRQEKSERTLAGLMFTGNVPILFSRSLWTCHCHSASRIRRAFQENKCRTTGIGFADSCSLLHHGLRCKFSKGAGE